MDYVEMIKDPQLVLGFQELIVDSDPIVVKRTIKVFTSVYHHTLRLLSSGELQEDTLVESWKTVKEVVDSLIAMVKKSDNEGILIHLLRFLEAAIMSHLMYDLVGFPLVFERGREVVKMGLKALKDLVTTPYVGGSVYIVGVRALISIACLRPDLWEPVTDLLKKQLTSLPPTLFDHNVRSLNKTLQRNLFRLLRRAETPQLKEKLIEMMVAVGVPRKVVMPWAPSSLGTRKRDSPTLDRGSGRESPPEKKLRETKVQTVDENLPPLPSKSPPRTVDPRLAPPEEPRKIPTSQASAPSTSCPPPAKDSNADLLFLTSLIPTSKNNAPTTKEPSPFEKELYERLSYDRICALVIQNIEKLPDEIPVGFVESFEKLGKVESDVEKMKERIASILKSYLAEFNISSFPAVAEVDPTPKTSNFIEKALEGSSKDFDKRNETSNSSSASSTPSSTPPLADTDLRQVYPRPSRSMGDVDMRVADPRLRDPRMQKDPRIRKDLSDPRLNYSESKETRIDPRVSNKPQETKPRVDPRLPQTDSTKKSPEPRKTRWDPRTPAPDAVATASSSTADIPLPPATSAEASVNRPSDPRVNRSQVQGLLPHPNSGPFQSQSMDPRLQVQTQGANDPRLQQHFTPPPFPFGPMNHLNQFNNPFMNGIPLNPNSMPPPVMNTPPHFSWQNNMPTQSSILVAQTLASVQSGILPPTMINL